MTATIVKQRTTLDDLVHEHQAGVWRYLRFLGSSEAEADDLTQETFLAVMKRPFEQRSPAETAAYLRTVTRNRLLALRRKSGRETSVADLEQAETVWAEVAGEDGGDAYLSALESCLETAIDDKNREVLRLRYTDSASRTDIAKQFSMTTDGVKTMLRRARNALRTCVEAKLNETREFDK